MNQASSVPLLISPYFLDKNQYQVPRDQWLFQVEGTLATHTEEAVRSAVIGSVRGAVRELLEFIGYGEEMSAILQHIKE